MANAAAGPRVLALAAILGIAAAIVGYYALSGLAARAGTERPGETRPVVVTTSDLTFGVKLDPAMLRIVDYPKDAVPAGAFSSIDSVAGQTIKVFMSAREPVTALKLSSRGGGLSMLVRPTMRAASIEVDQVSGVSGFVLPGDRVDVLTTVEQRGVQNDAITKTLLQNVEVLASGQKTDQKDNKPLSVQSVTLLVDPEGAEKLAHAHYEGKIHLVLRNPEDEAHVTVDQFSTREMLGRPVRRSSEPVRRLSPPVQTTEVRPKAEKVRIIRSSTVTEVPAVDSTGTTR